MEAPGDGKRNESVVENPEESNALLEFPNLNPFASFIEIEDERESKKRKEKSRKRKGEKNKVSKKKRRHGKASKRLFRGETDSGASVEISPWPAEWHRKTDSQARRYDDSEDSGSRTNAFRKGKSSLDTQGKSTQSPGKAARVENVPSTSFWDKSESTSSQRETGPWSVDWYQVADNKSANRNWAYEPNSDTERGNTLSNASGRYTYPEKTEKQYLKVATPAENKHYSREAGKKDERPETRDSSNDPMLYRSASIPVDAGNFRRRKPIITLTPINPDHKYQIRHSGNSSVGMCNPPHVVRSESEHTSGYNKSGSSRDFCGTVVNKMKDYISDEAELPNKQKLYGPVAQPGVEKYDVNLHSGVKHCRLHTRDNRSSGTSSEDSQADDNAQGVAIDLTAPRFHYGCTASCSINSKKSPRDTDIRRVSSHQPVAPPKYDYTSTTKGSSKEPHSSHHGQTEGPYQVKTPLGLNITADNRPSVLLQPSHLNEDAYGTIPRQHTISPEPSTSAAANQIGSNQDVRNVNGFYDVIIRSVPISFLHSMPVSTENVPKSDPSANVAIHLESNKAKIEGSLIITIDSASTSHALNQHAETVPMTPRQDNKISNPSHQHNETVPMTPGRDIEICNPSHQHYETVPMTPGQDNETSNPSHQHYETVPMTPGRGIEISNPSHQHYETVPMMPRQDTEMSNPSNEEIPHILRRNRRFRYLSLQNPPKVYESSGDDEMADDEMTDDTSDD